MPLRDEQVMTVKQGVVELGVEVMNPTMDEPEGFTQSVAELLDGHVYEIMSDPTILEPSNLEVASAVFSRDPLPAPLKEALSQLGFSAHDAEGGGHEESSVFSRFRRARRTKLERWVLPYRRAEAVSPVLAEIEACLIEDMPEGELWEVHEAGSQAVTDAARTVLRTLVAPGRAGVQELESHLLRCLPRDQRVVLHPSAVRALAAFTGDAIIAVAPESAWQDDSDMPLYVETEGGQTVRSDPVLRVIGFVQKGRHAALTEYLEAIVRQSSG